MSDVIFITVPELAKSTGRHRSTIRRWTDRLCQPIRTQGGLRLLTVDDAARVRAALAAKGTKRA